MVCKVKTAVAAFVRFLVNDQEFDPFKNGCEILVWGQAQIFSYSGVQNIIAGDAGNYPPEIVILPGDVLTITVTCDVPEQSLGLGLRPVKVKTVHVNTANITCPTVVSEAVFVLDESFTAGQNVNSVGVKIENGTWDATSNYSLGRLNP